MTLSGYKLPLDNPRAKLIDLQAPEVIQKFSDPRIARYSNYMHTEECEKQELHCISNTHRGECENRVVYIYYLVTSFKPFPDEIKSIVYRQFYLVKAFNHFPREVNQKKEKVNIV